MPDLWPDVTDSDDLFNSADRNCERCHGLGVTQTPCPCTDPDGYGWPPLTDGEARILARVALRLLATGRVDVGIVGSRAGAVVTLPSAVTVPPVEADALRAHLP